MVSGGDVKALPPPPKPQKRAVHILLERFLVVTVLVGKHVIAF